MHKFLFTVLALCVMLSCSSSKSKASPEQIQKLQKLVEGKNFEIVSDMAYPQNSSAMYLVQNSGLLRPGSSVSQINLIGNVNYLRIKGDSIFAELPYFGERRISSGYNGSDTSVIIENTMQNYTVENVEKDGSVNISFNARTKRELLRFNITLYTNNKSSIFLNGSTRSPIQYDGIVK